jgi:hypothetical protein
VSFVVKSSDGGSSGEERTAKDTKDRRGTKVLDATMLSTSKKL